FRFFLYTHKIPPEFYTLSLHDALPIFIARDIIDEKSFIGTAYFYKQGKPYRKALARFDLTGWGIPEEQFRRDYEGKVIKLGKQRSEEHTSELQSRFDLVCRLLLEKKNK